MDGVSLTANTRAALNNADGNMAVTALKMAAQSDQAIIAVVEQSAEAIKALPPPGQGTRVDKTA